jgi:hypothetical protein
MGQQLPSVRKYLSICIGPICSTDVSSPAILDVTALTVTVAFRTERNSNAVSENWTKRVSLAIGLRIFFEIFTEYLDVVLCYMPY